MDRRTHTQTHYLKTITPAPSETWAVTRVKQIFIRAWVVRPEEGLAREKLKMLGLISKKLFHYLLDIFVVIGIFD